MPQQFSFGRMGQVACWLNRRSYAQAWCLVVATVAIVSALDFATYDFELCIATLYIVPIALACWMFGPRESITTTIAVTLIAFTKYPLMHPDPNFFTTLWNGISRSMAFATLAAIVLSFRRSYDYVQFIANRDRMTGTLNKEAFDDEAKRRLDMARLTSSPILLAFLDLDGFKGVNDAHGHDAGDDVLRQFSDGAARELRRNDCFGRVGGDEFAMVLSVDSVVEAYDLAEDLHRRFTAVLETSGYPVTCSMGALIVPAGDSHNRRELMREADRLMYAAKNSGKNAVRIATATCDVHAAAAAQQNVVPVISGSAAVVRA